MSLPDEGLPCVRDASVTKDSPLKKKKDDLVVELYLHGTYAKQVKAGKAIIYMQASEPLFSWPSSVYLNLYHQESKAEVLCISQVDASDY